MKIFTKREGKLFLCWLHDSQWLPVIYSLVAILSIILWVGFDSMCYERSEIIRPIKIANKASFVFAIWGTVALTTFSVL